MNIGLDIIFFSIIIAFPLIGYFVGEEKSRRMLVGSMVGSFASIQLLILLNTANFVVVINTLGGYFGLVIISLCTFIPLLGKRLRDPKWPKSKLKAMFMGLLAGFVATGYSIASLAPESLNNLVTEYNLTALAYDLRIYALVISVVWLLTSYFTVGKPKK